MDSNLTLATSGQDLYQFDSSTNLALLNPRGSESLQARLMASLGLAPELSGHIFVQTSGTSSAESLPKWVALAKSAVLASAAASNKFLGETAQDVWFHLLPEFHVGGMGIWARSFLSGSRVVQPRFDRWDAVQACREIADVGATLISMVPTQVFDLVEARLRCPGSVRAILVGGGALADSLYQQARGLGWPLLRSYGMTETSSQAATEPLFHLNQVDPAKQYRVLPHLEVKTSVEGRIMVRGKSLLTGWIINEGETSYWEDPKDSRGWLTTQDFGEIKSGLLQVNGRQSDRFKVKGETVSLFRLESVLGEVAGSLYSHLAIAAVPDLRQESRLVLAFEPFLSGADAQDVADRFNEVVMPFEALTSVVQVDLIPRTDLGKVRQAELNANVEQALKLAERR